MSDLTRYRQLHYPREPMRKPHPDAFWTDKYGWMDSDDTLQQIADAWNAASPDAQRQADVMVPGLSDALTQEDDSEHD